MIEVQFNDETLLVDEGSNLAGLLVKQNYTAAGFAVALNNNFIPRAEHEATYLKAGDTISVIIPMSGG